MSLEALPPTQPDSFYKTPRESVARKKRARSASGRSKQALVQDGDAAIASVASWEIERGRAFAGWLRAALDGKRWTAKRLTDESYRQEQQRMSPAYVGRLLRGGSAEEDNRIAKPSRTFIERIARLTGADVSTGLAAAGYGPFAPVCVPLPKRFIVLPEDFPEEAEVGLRVLLAAYSSKPAAPARVLPDSGPENGDAGSLHGSNSGNSAG